MPNINSKQRNHLNNFNYLDKIGLKENEKLINKDNEIKNNTILVNDLINSLINDNNYFPNN